jgi:hypothetical protein
MLPENGSRIGFDFAEGDRSHSGSFEPKGKAADAAE